MFSYDFDHTNKLCDFMDTTKNFRNIPMYMGIVWLLCADKVAKTDGGEADESKIQCIEIIPTL